MAKETISLPRFKRPSRLSPLIKANGIRSNSGGEGQVEVKPHTLGDRKDISLSVLAALKEKHEHFCKLMGPRLALFLLVDAHVSLVDIGVAKYYQIAKEITPDLHFNVFRSEGATGSGVLGLAPQLALTAVNLLLGGKGDTVKQARVLTQVESDLTVDIVNMILDGWKALAKDAMEFEPKVIPEEVARVGSLYDPHTGVIHVKLKLKIKDCEGEGSLVFPVHMLASVVRRIERLEGSGKERAQNLTPKWSSVYGNVPLRPDVHLPGGRMTVAEFLELKPGVVIQLPERAMECARMCLNGRSLFEGTFGVAANRLALSLKQKLEV
jgi:flagellar motor switch protein FliM